MTRGIWRIMVWLTVLAFLGVGCAVQRPMSQALETAFTPQDLNSMVKSGDYVQKVDNFLVVLDASGSMEKACTGGVKFDVAKNLVSRMNQTIPELNLMGGLRAFGRLAFWPLMETKLYYGMTRYEKNGLQASLDGISQGRGLSPMELALKAAAQDLKDAKGNIAVIVFSDGVEEDMDYAAALAAAKKLKEQFGDRVCLYTVLIGKDVKGKKLMDQIPSAGGCGAAFNGAQIETPAAMADFVTQVFLAKAPPRPEPPRAVAPPPPPPGPGDRDKDGITDDKDRCPDTPWGAKVDEKGCWVLDPILFEFDKFVIRPQYVSDLNEIVAVMQKNPELKMQVEGHTCNMGHPAYNQKLSEKRAKAVKDYLVGKGINKGAISTKGYGASRPAASNDTKQGRVLNRRAVLEPSAR